MKPPPFRYHAPASIEEALDALARYGDEARVLAGGQSLIPALNLRLLQPRVLVDLNRIPALSGLTPTLAGGLSIGAMMRQAEAERHPDIHRRASLLTQALPFVGTRQIRNRGTLGGSIVEALPVAEIPGVCVALGARFRLRSRRGERWLGADEFFLGPGRTALVADELLTEIELPPSPRTSGAVYREVMRRQVGAALVGVATQVALDDHGRCRDIRVVLVGVAERPVRATAAERTLLGEAPGKDAVATAAARAHEDFEPLGDLHASSAFRAHLIRVLVEDTLYEAFQRSRRAQP